MTTTATRYSGFTGQRSRFMIGLLILKISSASETPIICDGFGFAAGTPPNVAQLPTARIAMAGEEKSFSISSISFPAIIPCPFFVGTPPSTTRI